MADVPFAAVSNRLRPLVRETIQNKQEEAPEFSHQSHDAALASFYERRNHVPAWLTGTESRNPQITALFACLEAADMEGLNPELYRLDKLNALVADYYRQVASQDPIDPHLVATLDILLTEAFFRFGSHLASGRVDPATVSEDWSIRTRAPILTRLLEKGLADGNVAEVLAYLRPDHPGYHNLRQVYLDHLGIVVRGGWPQVPEGPTLRPGERDERIITLRSRLAASGDLPAVFVSEDDLYDQAVEEAVRRFQSRHGLVSDGQVGKNTLAALNVPAAARVEQIAMNLERWRWLPRLFRPRHIMVNIADFRLTLVDSGMVLSTMRVVVGKKERPTPILSGELTYLELNPYWNIPHKLAQDDILPLVSSDPEYLQKQGIRVFSSWNATAAELASDSIDWVNLTPANFAYKLRQDPGPANALGRIKFIFQNKRSVYLHDTPARHLFRRAQRSFSSGCVRVEKPIELALELLRDDPGWTRKKLLEVIANDQTRSVDLPQPIPVYLLYWTAWVDEAGRVQFREDIYDYDTTLQLALTKLQAPALRILPPELLTLR
jgi:murein L,D-transpeptidase YcbB/YkuD